MRTQRGGTNATNSWMRKTGFRLPNFHFREYSTEVVMSCSRPFTCHTVLINRLTVTCYPWPMIHELNFTLKKRSLNLSSIATCGNQIELTSGPPLEAPHHQHHQLVHLTPSPSYLSLSHIEWQANRKLTCTYFLYKCLLLILPNFICLCE